MPITHAIRLIRKLWSRSGGKPGIADQTDFQILAEMSTDLIMRVAPDMRTRYASPSCLNTLGWTQDEMIGKFAGEYILAEDLPSIQAHAERINSGEADRAIAAFRVRRKSGDVVWMEGSAHVIRSAVRGAEGDSDLVVVMRDITERKRLEEELQWQALTDALTGLANRRAFDEALDREWRRTLRNGSRISLLLLDVDHFKKFNDHYGHSVGDDCLRIVAAAIKSVVQRPGDMVARYGGEEIAVILADTELDGAANVAEQIRAGIEALHLPNVCNSEGTGCVTASIGVATALALVGGTIQMPESLLLAADGALYKAKQGGRNCVATALLLAPKKQG